MPSLPPKTGFSFASFSIVVSARMLPSTSTPMYGVTRSSCQPDSQAAARFWCELKVSSSWSSRVMPHSVAVIAVCSPIERPVRASWLTGISGLIMPGRNFVSSASDLLLRVLHAIDVHQDLTEVFVQLDRRVGRGVGAAGDRAVDLAERDLVRHQDGGLKPGAAGLADVERRRLGSKLRAQHDFTRQVQLTRELQHCAAGEVADALAFEAVSIGQAVDGRGEHVLVGRVRVLTVGPLERECGCRRSPTRA